MAESKLRDYQLIYITGAALFAEYWLHLNTAKENLQKEKINSKSKPNISV